MRELPPFGSFDGVLIGMLLGPVPVVLETEKFSLLVGLDKTVIGKVVD